MFLKSIEVPYRIHLYAQGFDIKKKEALGRRQSPRAPYRILLLIFF